MSSNLPWHGTGSLKHGWILPPCASTEKNGKRKAHSLRRHYPVQVRRDFLSLICLHPWPNCQCKSRCRHPWCVSYVNRKIQKENLIYKNMKKKSFYYWDWHTNNKHYKEMSLFIWHGKTKHSPTAKNDWLQITILDQPISHWAPENFKQVLQIHEFLQEHSQKVFSVLTMIRWSVMKSSVICLNNKIHLPRGTL